MKLRKILSLVLLIPLFSIISCEDNIEFSPVFNNVVLNINENISEGVPFPISYNRLIENSLCPEGAICVWEGRAIVELTIDGDDTIFDLDNTILLGMGNLINTSAPKVFVYDNYSIELINVDTDGTITLKIEPSN
ncbi:MAG: hypothetical protein JXR05_00370 [Flavobacteriaceae bacterium]